eukprot:5673271-Pyramimonas_sp.AAC.1
MAARVEIAAGAAGKWVDPEVTAENTSFCGSSSGSTGVPKAMVRPTPSRPPPDPVVRDLD